MMLTLRKICPQKLKTKLVLLIFALVFFQVTIIGTFSIRLISNLLEEQIGSRALKVSQTVSLIPEIRKDLKKGDLKKSRIQDIAENIRRVTGAQYSELLRGQTHEYSNKLHTISGLIQIGAYDKAIELIGSETSGYQKLIHTLLSIVRDPIIAGTIMGKYNRSKELKVVLEIDPNSSMSDIPPTIKREKIVTILGNLLDNAFEAVLKTTGTKKLVRLSMVDLGHDLIFEFDDSGNGIKEEDYENIFKRGFTTKKKQGSGIGLYLVEQALKMLNGNINVGKSELGGTAVTVIIPKVQD